MPFANVNGQQIHYVDVGAGPLVLASHATVMDTVSLDDLTQALAAAGHRVVAFDLRGHGRTVSDGQPYKFDDVARDVLALADHLGADRFTFLGEGQGAWAGMRAAIAAPERFANIILIGASASRPEEGETMSMAAFIDVMVASKGSSPFFDPIVAHATSSASAAEDLRHRWAARSWDDIRNVAGAMAVREDFTDQLHRITCPALVLHATADFYFPLHHGQRIADNLGGEVEFVPIETTTHAITMAFDPRIAQHVLRWLASHPE